jgi:hypothetical protein
MRNMMVVICLLRIGPVYAIDAIEQQPFLIRIRPGPRSPVETITEPTDGVPIHLNDGSKGRLALKQLDKAIEGINPGEDYELSVSNRKGIALGKVNVVACYHSFQLAILDLVGDPGDEIVFISQDFHATRELSSPVLTIYHLDTRGLVAIGTTKVRSFVLPCAFYIDQAELDLTHKPVRFIFVRQWETCGLDLSTCSEFAIKRRCLLWSEMKGTYGEVAECSR